MPSARYLPDDRRRRLVVNAGERRNGVLEPHVAADLRVVPDRSRPAEDRRVGVDDHVVLDVRMALEALHERPAGVLVKGEPAKRGQKGQRSERIDTALLIQPQDFWYNARMRKNRFIGQDRCYHLISRLAHRAFFLDDDEKDRAVALMRVAA